MLEFESVIISAPIWIPALIALWLAINYFAPFIVEQFNAVVSIQVIHYLIITMPFWLPIVLAMVAWRSWILYVRSLFIFKLDFVLLEIKLPQEILKSPLAMETFLMSIYQTGQETTFIDRNWKGQVRPYFSLEIASIEGQVKFFIYTQRRFKAFIESGLYGFYPGIEIYEVPDYTRSVYFDKDEMDLYVIDYKKKNPDAYPIKTYVDYGIDKESVEDENKIDPLNSVIEFLGSIGKNQQFWLQFIIRGHKKEHRKEGTWFTKTDKWKDEAKAEVEKIRTEAVQKGNDDQPIKFPNPTKGQQERIYAVEKAVSKIAFDVGIRSIYMGKKDAFQGTNITGARTILRAFSAPHLNEFSPTHWLDGFDYPWEDFGGIRKNRLKREGLEMYKRRCFFYQPEIGHSVVLNVEELATMFHFPGSVSQTPTLTRVASKKSEAPSNLPI